MAEEVLGDTMSFGDRVTSILSHLPLLVAPIILCIFTLISAYVFKFRRPKGGVGFDYVIFTIMIVLVLYLGGAI